MIRKVTKIVLSITLFVAAAGAVAVYAMDDLHVSGTWRYKMTVVVETPEGIKTGSAVREVSSSASNIEVFRLPESTNPVKAKGEAVVVDLGERGTLFALLSGYKGGPDHAHSIVFSAFGGGTSVRGIQMLNSIFERNLGKSVTLDETDYPMLVTFGDSNDPLTVTPVFEMESDGRYPIKYKIKSNRFEELFGDGVRLNRITIELTDDPVTWGVFHRLPWLSNFYGKRFDGQRFGTAISKYPFANSLSAGAFSTGGDDDRN